MAWIYIRHVQFQTSFDLPHPPTVVSPFKQKYVLPNILEKITSNKFIIKQHALKVIAYLLVSETSEPVLCSLSVGILFTLCNF